MWIGYLVQSVISINNIGLGIWGWVLPGILISIDKWQSDTPEKMKKTSKTVDFSGMAMVMGLVVGGVIGYLPFNADTNFRHTIESGDAQGILTAAKKWPTSSDRLVYAAEIFNKNKMEDKAFMMSKEAVAKFPTKFDAWNFIYSSPWASNAEKAQALSMMNKLDPHNPDLKKLG